MSPWCFRMYVMNSWNELLVQAARAAVHGDIPGARLACRGSCTVLLMAVVVMLRLGRTKPRTPAWTVPTTLGATAPRLTPRPAPAADPNQPTHGNVRANSTAAMVVGA